MPVTDIRVLDAQAFFCDEYPRASLKFGDQVAGKLRLRTRARAENRFIKPQFIPSPPVWHVVRRLDQIERDIFR